MAKSPRQINNWESKAEDAFADFVAMGADRSLAKLAKQYQSSPDPSPTKHIETLKNWSSRYKWQERIKTAATERSERLLNMAAELDADSFLKTSIQLNSDITHKLQGSLLDVTDVVKIRESVRKPAPKGGASVDINLNISVQVRQALERLARDRGLTVEEVMEEAEYVLSGGGE